MILPVYIQGKKLKHARNKNDMKMNKHRLHIQDPFHTSLYMGGVVLTCVVLYINI